MRFMRIITVGVFSACASAGLANPEYWSQDWPDTDFQKTSIPDWSEIRSGGPPKDGIPAINDPTFHKVASETGLSGREPVITVDFETGPPRAYPIRYLLWHEIVNDTVKGVPIAVTFCPLCNSGMTFDRRVGHRVLTFGVSGKLRHSDMIMFDRETQSWWQQAIGTAIIGELTGTELHTLPTWMESWDQFRARAPNGVVMVEPVGYRRDYGRNPYIGYDSAVHPFLYDGETPPNDIPPLARVVRVGSRAWPLTRLRDNGTLAEADVVLSWSAGQASALDTANIGDGKDVGSIRVRNAAGQDIAHDVMFAFAFHAFWPDGQWMTGN